MDLETLVDQMTLEEQVSLLSGADFWTTNAVERLGIPKIKVTDGPNGARGGGSFVGGLTSACFPAAISLGSTWAPELVRAMGEALAEEAKSKSARVLLAPTVNIHRTGLNGRNFECYSEDPDLTTELAVAYVEGVQSRGIAATIKHFVANESEIERYSMSSDVDERSLRELYFPPFEAAVKRAGVQAVMSSYNRLNGTFTSEHHWLLTDVLRGEWGFDGIVMSDWFGSHATAETVNAGLDLEMPGPTRDRGDKLVAAVKAGTVASETVRASALRMLKLIERVGAFADPVMADEREDDRPAHRALIRTLGAEGTVLLKNDGTLPLPKAGLGTLAVLGPNSDQARIMGGGSAQLNAHYRVSPIEGIRTALAGSNAVFHARGVANSRLVKRFDGEIAVDYFANTDLSGPVLTSKTLPFGEVLWLDKVHPAIDMSAFSARLHARFVAEEDGLHRIGLVSAGRVRLFVNGEKRIEMWDDWKAGDNFFGAGSSEAHAEIALKAGDAVNMMIEFRSPLPGDSGLGIGALRLGIEKPYGQAEIDEAVARAREAEYAIVFAGREGEWDTEGNDLPHFSLPGRQDELIAAVAAANPKTIVVLQTGGPILMPWLDQVAAVLQAWYPGQEAGNAIADVLFGDAEPGGRLPQTFPRAASQFLSLSMGEGTYPGKDGHVAYTEGLAVGYRHTDKAGIDPLFPFGFGLSYSRHEWSAASLSGSSMDGGSLTAQVTVTNVGERAGSDVVQLYVAALDPVVDRPVKELRAFEKVRLQAGESRVVSLSIGMRDLCRFDVARQSWVADPGRYEIRIGASATDIRFTLPFTLSEEWIEPARG